MNKIVTFECTPYYVGVGGELPSSFLPSFLHHLIHFHSLALDSLSVSFFFFFFNHSLFSPLPVLPFSFNDFFVLTTWTPHFLLK